MRLKELKKYTHTGQGYESPGLDRGSEQWRGPHEGRELQMMLDNVKPAAFVTPEQFEKFKPYVEQGRFLAKKYTFRKQANPYPYSEYIVVQPGEKYRMNKIAQVLDDAEKYIQTGNWDLYSAKLGRLLGYDKEHIRNFISIRA